MISKKIKKNDGITIIHALVSVLIFGIFSSIILNAATSNIKSVQNQISYQQAYLTVSSASNLFLDSFDGDYIENIVINKENEEISNYWNYIENDEGLANPLYTYGNAENDVFLGIFKSLSEKDIETRYVMIVSKDSDKLQEVAVQMFVNEESVKVNFSLNNSDQNDNYYMTIEIPFVVMNLEENDILASTTTITKQMYFDVENAVISKGVYNVPKVD